MVSRLANQTTYRAVTAGETLVECDTSSKDVTLTRDGVGLTIPANEWEQVVSGYASLKA